MPNKDKYEEFLNKFGKEKVGELINEFGMSSEKNFFRSYSTELMQKFDDVSDMKNYILYLIKTEQINDITLRSTFFSSYKRFRISSEANPENQVEEFEDEMETKNEELGGLPEYIERMESSLDEIKEGINVIAQDETEIELARKIGNIQRTLEGLSKAKTEKKATSKQVEKIAVTIDEMKNDVSTSKEDLKILKKTLPNASKFYTAKHLYLALGSGIVIAILLFLVAGFVVK